MLGTARGLREQQYRGTVLRAAVSRRQQGLGTDQSSQVLASPFPSCTPPPASKPSALPRTVSSSTKKGKGPASEVTGAESLKWKWPAPSGWSGVTVMA